MALRLAEDWLSGRPHQPGARCVKQYCGICTKDRSWGPVRCAVHLTAVSESQAESGGLRKRRGTHVTVLGWL